MALTVGTRVGPFEIVSPIAAGGMGEVYRARDTRLDRVVAIKVLRPEVAADPDPSAGSGSSRRSRDDRLRRFEQEARAASALNHPNILTIYDIGREQGTAYIAMEWVDGDTLRAILRRGRVSLPRLLDIGHQFAEGLAKAHAAGIVHRDLKPENVMVTTDGLVKIVDFGLAKLRAGAASELETATVGTAAGVVMGTVGYMSPEQASGQPADYRSDQFVFGLILYEMATATRPFARDTAAQTMAATIEAEAPSIVDLNPDVPEHLSLVVDRCLRKVPAERYDSTRDLARDLEQIRHHSGTRAPARLSGAAVQPVRQRRWLPAIAMLGSFILLAVVAGFWMRGSGAIDPAEPPLVAVRAFRNLTADGAQDHFAAGMTEEIRGQLSKMAALRLLSGAAVAAYGPGDVARMVTDLGVTSVVDGSVRRDQNRVRVSVELVDARTGQLRWSDQYEREIADVFAVQSEIALAVAQTLQANLSPAERARVEKRPTDNLEAYDLYLRSQQLLPLTEQAQNVAAMELLNQAIALDPRFAVAKARLAYRVFFESSRGDAAAVDRGMAMAREAADLDPTLAYPHFVLGSAFTAKGMDAQARLGFMRALELDPNHTSAMSNLSFHEYLFGRLDESLMWARRMFLLSDRKGNAYYHVAAPLLALRDDELSWRWVTEAERRAPHNRVSYMVAYAELLRGDAAGAMARVRGAVERWPGNDELIAARAEFAYLTRADDADILTLEVTNRTPDILGGLMGLGSRVRRAWSLKRQGDPRWVQEVAEVLRVRGAELAAGSESALAHLDIAAALMLQDHRDEALESMTRSFKSGYREYALLEADPIFAPLRADARFVKVMEEMKAEVARLRRRAAERGLLDLDSLAPGVK